jgi:hypothetical protein
MMFFLHSFPPLVDDDDMIYDNNDGQYSMMDNDVHDDDCWVEIRRRDRFVERSGGKLDLAIFL